MQGGSSSTAEIFQGFGLGEPLGHQPLWVSEGESSNLVDDPALSLARNLVETSVYVQGLRDAITAKNVEIVHLRAMVKEMSAGLDSCQELAQLQAVQIHNLIRDAQYAKVSPAISSFPPKKTSKSIVVKRAPQVALH